MSFTKILTTLFLFLYFLWESFWYYKVGLNFVKWHTHFFFFIYVFISIHYILKLLKAKKEISYYLFVLFLGFQATEIILIVTGLNKTNLEKQYGYYNSSKPNSSKENYYWINEPNSSKTLRAVDGEFLFTRKTNTLGYSDQEWKLEKDSNEFRIICLGDSFTEGDGAHADSSYVSFLKKNKLFIKGKKVSFMNAGKCGSDPFFNFINYRDILLKFKPDLIIQTISEHDIKQDINERGGFERFKKNYKLEFKAKPKNIEFLYATSYTLRVFLKLAGYNELMIDIKNYEEDFIKDKNKIIDLFQKYKALADQNESKLLVILLPAKHNSETNEYAPFFNELVNSLRVNQRIQFYDLLPFYNQKFKQKDSKIAKYYWVKDGHHNARGYKLMSDGIQKGIIEITQGI